MSAYVYNITSETDLQNALKVADQYGASGDTITMNFAANVTLTNELYGVNLSRGDSVIINGNGYSLDGAGKYRGLFAYSGSLAVNDLAIQNALAVGGNGAGGGGGGAGLGGGLFVGASANVSLSDVTFYNDSARGGDGGNSVAAETEAGGGGGGGLGGDGGSPGGFFSNPLTSDFFINGGGGGGVGVSATGGGGAPALEHGSPPGVGILLGAFGGGSASGRGNGPTTVGGADGGGGAGSQAELEGTPGGGGGVSGHTGGQPSGGFGGGGGGWYGSGGVAGDGGFGGGGGAAAYALYNTGGTEPTDSQVLGGIGGNGGFGGGGGWGKDSLGFAPGSGGWGATNANNVYGGNGLGAGGAVFVEQGGGLTLSNVNISGGYATGGSNNGNDQADGTGAGIFLQGNAVISLSSTTIGSTLGDEGSNYRSTIVITGGEVDLTTLSSFYGVAEIQDGTTLRVESAATSDGLVEVAGTLINQGVIYRYNVYLADQQGAAIINYGTLNGVSYLNTSPSQNGTVVNAGVLLSSEETSTHNALLFAPGVGGGMLVEEAGASYAQDAASIYGGGLSALQLAAGTAAIGTMNYFGTDIVGFNSVTVDAGAYWRFTSGNSFANGVVLQVAGDLQNLGSIGVAVTLESTGIFENSVLSGPVTSSSGGFVKNTPAATISSGYYGIRFNDSAGTVQNFGTIQGGSAEGVGLRSGGYLYNFTYGVITGGYGVYIGNQNHATGTVNNQGTIISTRHGHYAGVYLFSGGSVNNGGTIASDYGPALSMSGTSSTVNNAGLITAATYGILFTAKTGTLTNSERISANNIGVLQSNGGHFLNESGATVYGSTLGVQFGSGAIENAGMIDSQGIGIKLLSGATLTNEASGVVRGLTGVYAIDATIVNAGTILSESSIAVEFESGSFGRLVLDPGAKFGAEIIGGGAQTILELAAGGVGTISGLGANVIGFGTITVDTSARWEMSGVNTLQNSAIYNAGSILLGASTLVDGGTVQNSGGILIDQGGYAALGELFGGGSVTLDVTGTLEVAGTASNTQSISFVGSSDVLVSGDAANFSAIISGFGSGDTIELDGFTASTINYVSGTGLELSDDSTTVTLDIVGDDLSTADFQYAVTSFGTALTVECFCAGTRIATPEGEVAVEMLRAGDMVATLTRGPTAVKFVTRRSFLIPAGASSDKIRPIRIAAGAIAENIPCRDLYVSPDHAMYFDGILVPAHLLINQVTVLQPQRFGMVDYFHVAIEPHDIIIAEGAPSESYLDIGNRSYFADNAVINLAEIPEPLTWEDACAPLILFGAQLEKIRTQLLSRSNSLPEKGLVISESKIKQPRQTSR